MNIPLLSLTLFAVIGLIVITTALYDISKDEFGLKFWTGIYITSMVAIIAIIVTLLTTDHYHNKKTKSEKHFESQKNKSLEKLIHSVGFSFSQFKEEYEHLIGRKKIYEQDLTAYGTKDYSNLIHIIEHNHNQVSEKRSNYLQYLTSDEYYFHEGFFNTMLRFVRTLQVKQDKDIIDEENEIKNALIKLNEDLEIIESQKKQYDGISHTVFGTSTLSRHSSLQLDGIKYYKVSCPLY